MPAPDRPLRLLLGAFGDPGHAFPLIALGGALAARGHEVVLQTWTRWADDVRAVGMRFEPAPEYQVFPTRERPLKPYEAVVRATAETARPWPGPGGVECAARETSKPCVHAGGPCFAAAGSPCPEWRPCAEDARDRPDDATNRTTATRIATSRRRPRR